ncbi:MAG: acetyltransferase [Cocleimonas sp.]|jgi:acetyltransferase
MSEHYLKALFDPSSIVIVGASETKNSVAALITKKIHQQFTGKVYFVNPKHKKILEQDCFKSINDINYVIGDTIDPRSDIKNNTSIDLAIIVSPLRTVENSIRKCAKIGISNVLVMTHYPSSYKLEITSSMKSLLKVAQDLNVRLLGPNATALIRPSINFNASLTDNKIQAGKLALVSRSSSICNSIVDWAETEQIGFSSIVSNGSVLDLNLSDILDFLANDIKTSCIVIHINQVIHSRHFMSALKAAAMRKPVVILKSSRNNGSYSDAISKTIDVHAMDDVFRAAVLRAGANYAPTLTKLYTAAKILASNQRTKGNRLAIISNGYGPMMLANDRLRALNLATNQLSPSLISELKKTSDTLINHENAVIIFDQENIAKHYVNSIKLLLASKEVDAIAIILAPNPMFDSLEVAAEITKAVKPTKKPVLAIWLGTSSGGKGRKFLIKQKISNYRTPEAAIDAFSFLCNHLTNIQNQLKIPYPLKKQLLPNLDAANAIIGSNLKQKRNVLSKMDSIRLLEAFHIKSIPSMHTESLEDAIRIAEGIGYPVVLKIDTQHLRYKSDVSGVVLNINNEKILRKSYLRIEKSISNLPASILIDGILVEKMNAPTNSRFLNISILNDPAFGPVISFGGSGIESPIVNDRAIQLPPVNRRLAEELINNTQVSLFLDKYRNLPAANREKLRGVLIRVSEIAVHLPQVFELSINPLVLDENQALGNDVRIVIQKTSNDNKHFSHLAIHPYPSDWRRRVTIKKNKSVELRPIRGEDAQAEIELVNSMSRESKYLRFMHAVNEISPEMLSRFTKFDYDREMAFGAFLEKKNKEILIGVSRYAINPDKQSCEFAIAIADEYHGLGLAKQLMLILIEHVKDHDLKIIEGTVLKNNTSMDKLMSSLGFSKHSSPDEYEINIFRLEFDS